MGSKKRRGQAFNNGSSSISSKPRSLKEKISLSDGIQIIIVLLTCCSLILNKCTLNEMQEERNAAYKPSILVNPSEFEISWDSNGEESWVSLLPSEDSSYKVNTDGSISGTIDLPINIYPNNKLEDLTATNIGVGAAKDIRFVWDQNNLSHLSDYLTARDPSKLDFCTYGESVAFSFGGKLVVTDIDRTVRLMYMLPNAAETYPIPLPMAYSILIHEIMKCDSLAEPPYIALYIEYTDVQGRDIKDTFLINIIRTYYQSAPDNSGSAMYQLVPILVSG